MTQSFTPDPSLYPFESKWFDSSVGRVHYIDEGRGTALLLLHGNPTWSFLYRHIVRNLRDAFRCVALDYPGFGLSVRPAGYGYTPPEHAGIVGELVDHLGLDGYVYMGQDWGGPIGLKVATERADRVSGIVLGNTWFWPADRLMMTTFSRAMSSSFMQKRIIEKNFFVEKLMPRAMARKLTDKEMDHYRKVQASPDVRKGVAEFPREIRAAAPFLADLAQAVPQKLGSKPALLVWGMKDFAFRPNWFIPRIRESFTDCDVVELTQAKHYIQEDAPDQISEAITKRFG
jgi:haloalkane dehalogenase